MTATGRSMKDLMPMLMVSETVYSVLWTALTL
jgi:hypothetical protein